MVVRVSHPKYSVHLHIYDINLQIASHFQFKVHMTHKRSWPTATSYTEIAATVQTHFTTELVLCDT